MCAAEVGDISGDVNTFRDFLHFSCAYFFYVYVSPLATAMNTYNTIVRPRNTYRPSNISPYPFPLACNLPPKNTKQQLEHLLSSIPEFIMRAASQAEETATNIPNHVKNLFGPSGPFSFLTFWRSNEQEIRRTAVTLRDSAQLLADNKQSEARKRASALDLSWLRNSEPVQWRDVRGTARGALLFLADSLTPWDYDRHDLGLTFANVWHDTPEPAVGVGDVKLTSTIKPLEKEWKVSARTRLLEMGDDVAVFAKAGMFLAGGAPPYIGLEADKMWPVAGLDNTKIFANINYRSSRKPTSDVFMPSFGVQQAFEITKGFDLHLRFGVSPFQEAPFFVSPIPNGSYF